MTSPTPTIPTARPSDGKDSPSKDTNSTVKPGRGRKPGIEAKVRPDIPAEEMQLIVLPAKQKADLRRKREERKAQQKAVDTIVYDVFEENVAIGMDHGTVANWADLYVYDWPISKTHAENAQFMLDKACRLYNRRLILGEQVEVPANKSHNLPDPEGGDDYPCHLNGKEHVHIPFSVVRRAVKVRNS